MNIDNLRKTYRQLVDESKFHRVIIAALLATNFVSVVGWLNKSTVIDMQPPGLAERAWVDESRASDAYVEGWALYIADRLGNVKPKSASMIRNSLEPLLSADIYQDVINKIESQVQQIRQDRVVLAFEPKEVLRDKNKTNKFYVVGRSVMSGPTGKPVRDNKTYELDLRVKNYKPVLYFIDVYSGAPRTEDVIRREEKAGEARKRMDRNNDEN
ncbi:MULTISPECIES: TraE/TraK family type IV conjugative transfer system protein [Pseudomonas]|jgi:conjugal transfer pilus assembly protein TraE|uniref:Conjugal transfer protein n=1 Tax=Pseudomonas cremoris TaxID=2724178 RepID=A0ABR6TF48_9PSED|nr:MULTISPECIES: TraE/TraK family type IV conjugative transfer system protein [Pseudomonas]MBC2384555.1 conjugal transfer protein [Pseudomonas cremoris]MBJ2181689.1 pilus assembly protein [Pseudomonas veronii]